MTALEKVATPPKSDPGAQRATGHESSGDEEVESSSDEDPNAPPDDDDPMTQALLEVPPACCLTANLFPPAGQREPRHDTLGTPPYYRAWCAPSF